MLSLYSIPLQTTNPPPDRYEYNHPKLTAALHPVSSSFKSRTPRFSTSHTVSVIN